MDVKALEALHRAKWTQASREAYHKEHPENFAGPDMSYPIKDGSDVGDAWGLAGHADNPDAVRAKIKSIAKRLGLEGSLPDTAKEDNGKERSMNAATMPTPSTDEKSPHPPMTGKHSHAHPHMDGYDHEHEHEHNNDNIHDHAHTHAQHRALDAGLTGQMPVMYAPITRIDQQDWIIEGQATSETLDHYGTVFEYESSKRAFQDWMQRGNIREQHDPKKAVGKALAVEFDDANKIIFVRARISKGARDTWEKILDGTLSGFSVGMRADAKVRYIERAGKQVPMYYDTVLNELSVVDAPGSPNCDIAIARADGMITDVVDDVAEEPPAEQKPLERAGARMSKDTQSKMHDSIAHTLRAASAQMQNCGCADCCAAMKLIDPDEDGDIDLGGYDDPDNDWRSLYGGEESSEEMGRTIAAMIERALSPVYTRLQAIAGTIARSSNAAPQIPNLETLMDGAITRALASTTNALQSNLSEVRADLSAVKETVDRIENTPMPGAPVLNTGAIRPTDKVLSTDPYAMPRSTGSAVADAVAALSMSGQLDTTDKQVQAVAAALAAQRRG